MEIFETTITNEELEEQEWDRLLATPESDAFLDMLEEEVVREYSEGKTKEGGFGYSCNAEPQQP